MNATDPVRVLVVDDAEFMRRSIVNLLTSDGTIDVIGQAKNGVEAHNRARDLRPDVVCMDVDMPEMDGITALKHIMTERPTPVVVVSSLTDRADVPFEALRLGAIDFFPKLSSRSGDFASQARHLIYLVRTARWVRRANLRRIAISAQSAPSDEPASCSHVLVVGGTLGSVAGLIRLLTLVPPYIDPGVCLLFRVPLHPSIRKSFATSLSSYLGWRVSLLEDTVTLHGGEAHLIPTTASVSFDGSELVLHKDDTGSMDELFTRSAQRWGQQCSLVLLGGDRPDGLIGLQNGTEHGAAAYLQDERTALFSDWPPGVSQEVTRFDWDHIVELLLKRLEG